MRPDAEYIKRLLTAFRDSTTPTTDVEQLQNGGFDLGAPAFEFHMELLLDDGYIESESRQGGWGLRKGADGYRSWSAIPLRLTSSGHEFAEAIENPQIFPGIREKLVGASIGTMKEIAVAALKAEIMRHSGLKL